MLQSEISQSYPTRKLWDNSHMSELTKNLRNRIDAAGLSAQETSIRAGLGKTAVSEILRGKSKDPRSGTLEKIGKVLGCTVADLVGSHDDVTPATHNRQNLDNISRQPPVMLPQSQELPADLPVYGTAAGAIMGAFQMFNEVADYVRRPPGVPKETNAYGLYVVGDCMAPRFEDGELIIVHPGRPVRPGDYVVVQFDADGDGERAAMIKRLVRRTKDWLFLEQLNPRQELSLHAEHVISIHRVLSPGEMLGYA